LGVAEAANLKLDFMAKKHRNSVFWFEYVLRCYSDTKTTKTPFGRIDTLKSLGAAIIEKEEKKAVFVKTKEVSGVVQL